MKKILDRIFNKTSKEKIFKTETIRTQILRVWDKSILRGIFPHLGSDSHWTFGKIKLSAFRSPEEWLVIMETFTYYRCYGKSIGFDGRCDSERVEQTVNGVTTEFIVNLNSKIPQVLSDGTYTYLYGQDRIAQSGPNGTEYFLTDGLGSVRQLVDSAGAVTMTKSYEPYGEVLSTSGGAASRYGYAGEQMDESGLVYLRARMYSPVTGGFQSKDPWRGDMRVPMSYNAWLYAYANPVIHGDPSGKCVSDEEGNCLYTPSPQNYYLAAFIGNSSDTDKGLIEAALWDVATGYSRAYNDELKARQRAILFFKNYCADFMQDYLKILTWNPIGAMTAFGAIHGGKITFTKTNDDGPEWGADHSYHEIYLYKNGFYKTGAGINPVFTKDPDGTNRFKRFIVHEVGHAFDNATTRTIGNQMGRNATKDTRGHFNDVVSNTEGFYGPRVDWQWRLENTHTELFADMFVGWTYGRFEVDESGQFTDYGQRRYDFMNNNMKDWIFNMVNPQIGRK